MSEQLCTHEPDAEFGSTGLAHGRRKRDGRDIKNPPEKIRKSQKDERAFAIEKRAHENRAELHEEIHEIKEEPVIKDRLHVVQLLTKGKTQGAEKSEERGDEKERRAPVNEEHSDIERRNEKDFQPRWDFMDESVALPV